jgi:proteasome accessory factor B
MNLIALLFASKSPVPFREIAGRVIGYDDLAAPDALEKRFDRDKSDLRSLGIPITYKSAEHGDEAGYVVDTSEVFQQKVVLTPQESLLLAIAGRVGAPATGGGALEEALKGALRKLAVDTVGVDPLAEMVPVTVLRTCSGDPITQKNVAVLSDALTGNQSVSFRYQGMRDDQPRDRVVNPYGLGLARGAWYLVGHCHLRVNTRVFRVSRILGGVTANPKMATFEVPDAFQLEDYLKKEFWEFGSGEMIPITLALRGGAMPCMEGMALKETRRDGEWTILETELRHPRTVIPWVLSSGGDVRVLAPLDLRAQVAARRRRSMRRSAACRIRATPTSTVRTR